MIVIAGLILGAILGAARARAHKGNRLDILHYAAVHAIAFGMLGLFVTLIIDYMA
jgi:hypothetical protein